MWVTYRYALQKIGLTDQQIGELDAILVHAPNGITWRAYQVQSDKEGDNVERKNHDTGHNQP